MANDMNEKDVMNLLDSLFNQVVKGIPHIDKSVYTLASDYTSRYSNPHTAAKKMINTQVKKCTITGVLAGLGGAVVLPVAIPADIGSVLFVQMRMIACTAVIAGLDINSDQVKTMIYACLAGVSIDNLLKNAGIQAGEKFAVGMIKKIPGEALVKINQKVGFRLLTKFGEKGIINLGKAVPVLGGVIGGAFDYTDTKIIGTRCYKVFILGDIAAMSDKNLDRTAYKVVPADGTEKLWTVLDISSSLDIENHYHLINGSIEFADVVCTNSELKKLRKKLDETGTYLISKLTSEEYKYMLTCPTWTEENLI